MKKIALLLLMITAASSSVTSCSIDDTLNEAGYSSISKVAIDIIDKAFTLAEEVSADDIKQQYEDSRLKEAFEDMVEALEQSYITYDYVVDTSSLKELYRGEEDGMILAVFSDESGKVYLVNYLTKETTVFTGDAVTDLLYSYIEKASGLNLGNYKTISK